MVDKKRCTQCNSIIYSDEDLDEKVCICGASFCSDGCRDDHACEEKDVAAFDDRFLPLDFDGGDEDYDGEDYSDDDDDSVFVPYNRYGDDGDYEEDD